MMPGRAMCSVAGLAVLVTLAAGIAGITGSGAAHAAVDCPAVVPPPGELVGTVTPAPTAGADWSGCDLSHADFGGMTLTDVNFSGANLADAEFHGAHITGSDFTDTDLENDDFQGDTLTGTSLAGADISLTYFDAGSLAGLRSGGMTDPAGAPNLPRGWELRDGYLLGPGADFSGMDFSALAGKQGTLSDWNLSGSTFANADAAGLDLNDDELQNALFTGTTLTNADLHNSILTGASLQSAGLAGANLAGEQSGGITGTPAKLPANWSLRDGYLVGPKAWFASDNLDGLNLTGADLEGAQFTLSTLVGVNLTDADLRGAYLDTQDDLTGVIWSNTICPDGTNSDNDGGTCAGNIDDVPPVARPLISGPSSNGWYHSVTVAWNWSDAYGTINPAKCPASTATAKEGAPTVLTGTCWNIQGLEATSTESVKIDSKPPAVGVTGVKAGAVYAAGHVPTAGCRTTDAISGVQQKAKLKITTTGSNGVGAYTATCSGGMDFADLTAPPVKVNYTVAYGLSAFPAPANNATLARSAHSFPVAVKLGQISATPAAKLSAAGGVRAVLSGPGISPETVTLKWQSKTAEFTASMPIPAKVKTGQTYVITIKENIGTGLISVPRLGPTLNPGNMKFK